MHSEARSDWILEDIKGLFETPFADLIYRAQTTHRAHHDPNKVQRSTLLSIKTGGCVEDCGYCSQSAHHDAGLKASKLMRTADVLGAARAAKAAGSERFCMGAAWRSPKDRDMPAILEMVRGVRDLGLETCMTLGMLSEEQAFKLKEAGLDYYNHNLDTAPERYDSVVSTRTWGDRIRTLAAVRRAGVNVCCGGILGMGETRHDRASFLHALATQSPHPASVPLNVLVPIRGTPLGDDLLDGGTAPIDDIEFVRTVAVARICMPNSMVRLSAGRESMSDACQALCFIAGANSIFTGDQLLTAPNAGDARDDALFAALGMA